MIAGVCNGIADHFNIDPVLVRIGFVIATFFGGAGAVAYGAAWLLIPADDERTSIGERVVREHRWGRIAGVVLIAIAISTLAQPVWWWGGHGLFPVLLIVGGLFLLSPGFSRDTDEATSDDAAPPMEPPTTRVLPTEPPPPPRQPRQPRRRRRGGLGAVTLGLLLIGAGIVGIVAASGNSVEPTFVFAGGLMIVGAALVLSAWVGRSLFLIPIGVVLIGLMSVSTVIDVPITGGIGEKRETPFSVTDVQREYHLGIGELSVDLTHVDFERGHTYDITATVGIGHVIVRIPRDVTAELHGHAGMGEVRFLDQHDGGVDVERDATLNASGEGPSRVVLDLQVGLGQVEVQDAAA